MSVVPFEVAHHMALVPLGWLVLLAWRGYARAAQWWWLSGAFAVSKKSAGFAIPSLMLL